MNRRLEGNKILCEFLGYKLAKCNNGLAWESPFVYASKDVLKIHGRLFNSESTYLKFDSDWNQLMLIVEKINLMKHFEYSVTIFTMNCKIENQKGEIVARCECENNPDQLILSVWECVVEFVNKINNKEIK